MDKENVVASKSKHFNGITSNSPASSPNFFSQSVTELYGLCPKDICPVNPFSVLMSPLSPGCLHTISGIQPSPVFLHLHPLSHYHSLILEPSIALDDLAP